MVRTTSVMVLCVVLIAQGVGVIGVMVRGVSAERAAGRVAKRVLGRVVGRSERERCRVMTEVNGVWRGAVRSREGEGQWCGAVPREGMFRTRVSTGVMVVEVWGPRGEVWGDVKLLSLRLLAVLLLMGGASVAASWAMARDIVVEVEAVTTQAGRMARGEARAFDRVVVRARDEVGALVAAFNQLQERFEEEGELHRESLARLEVEDKRREAMVATLRHELRTPLNAVLGFAELLLSGVEGELTESQREDIDAIAQAGRHLRRLVDDVFDLSAMANGRFALSREGCDLAAVAREVVREAEGVGRSKGVTLVLEGCDEARAWVDPVAMRRALTNLVLNAVEHAGGAVRVRLTESEGGGWNIEVEDNGPGIPAGELRRLFRPFERGRTAEARGAGLGLAITLGLVELHGGTLSATARTEGGSTFTVSLPRSERA